MHPATKKRPLYRDIEMLLRRQIASRRTGPGGFFASESELTRTCRVSRITVRKAVDQLVRDGLLVRVPGKGLQVPDPRQRRSTRQDHTLIGVIVTDFTDSFFAEIIKGIQSVTTRTGFHALLCDTDNRPENEALHILNLKERQAAGYLIAPVVGADPINHHYLEQIVQDHTPLVLLDRHLPSLATDCVLSDNVRGGYLATQHLLALGHRRIGFIGAGTATSVEDRYAGYRNALAESGVPLVDQFVHHATTWSEQAGYNAAKHFLGLREPPTAIFASTDLQAMGVMKAAYERNLRIPEALSVVGYDDLVFSKLLNPPLTTIAQDKFQMGKTAAEILIRRIKGEAQSVGKMVIPVTLVVRASTAPFPGAERRRTRRKSS